MAFHKNRLDFVLAKYFYTITLIYNSIQIDYTISKITTDETSFSENVRKLFLLLF